MEYSLKSLIEVFQLGLVGWPWCRRACTAALTHWEGGCAAREGKVLRNAAVSETSHWGDSRAPEGCSSNWDSYLDKAEPEGSLMNLSSLKPVTSAVQSGVNKGDFPVVWASSQTSWYEMNGASSSTNVCSRTQQMQAPDVGLHRLSEPWCQIPVYSQPKLHIISSSNSLQTRTQSHCSCLGAASLPRDWKKPAAKENRSQAFLRVWVAPGSAFTAPSHRDLHYTRGNTLLACANVGADPH